jgi:hypothetical protein
MSDRSNIYRDIFNGTNQKRWETEQKQNSMIRENGKIKHLPDPKKHKIISFIKSGIRIAGYILIPFNLDIAALVLIFSEIVGIVEEMV